jgi:iron(III) transport system ATP-binding protein
LIEQQGTPQEMYNTADALRRGLHGQQQSPEGPRRADGRSPRVAGGDGWQLWGRPSATTKSGAEGVGMIRLERVRLAQGPGENRVEPELTTSMFLGDKWEHIFHLGDTTLRAHSADQLQPGRHWIELPRPDFWIF